MMAAMMAILNNFMPMIQIWTIMVGDSLERIKI
jgi:hypothetical protein